MEVHDSIKTLRQRQAAEHPVAQAKRNLEPTRKLAQQYFSEFEGVVQDCDPIFCEARQMRDLALGLKDGEIRYWCQQLNLALQEVDGGLPASPGLLVGGAESFRDIIARIDGLTEWDLVQGIADRLPGNLQARRANIGALRELAAKIHGMAEDLKTLIKEKATTDYRPPSELSTPTTRAAGVKVVSDFDV